MVKVEDIVKLIVKTLLFAIVAYMGLLILEALLSAGCGGFVMLCFALLAYLYLTKSSKK